MNQYRRFLPILFLISFLQPVFTLYTTSEQNTRKLTVTFQKTPYSLNFIKEFDHNELHIHSAIYSGLLSPSPNSLSPRVGLAISWFVNEEQTTYTFNLRKHAVFADNSPITAQDVKDSWLAAIEAQNAFIYLFEIIEGVSEYVLGDGTLEDIALEVVSDRVFKVSLKEPAPYFLKAITHPSFSVSSSRQVQIDDWDSHALDIDFSGPFVVKTQNEESLTLAKNINYWDAQSIYLDEIEIKFHSLDDGITLSNDINNGSVQWSTFFSEGREDLDDEDWLIVHPIFGMSYLFFGDTQSKPWNNANVRTAIKLFLPLDILLNEQYTFPASSLVPPIRGSYEPEHKFSTQDIEAAYQLLEDEGYPKGKGLGELVLFVPLYQNGEYDPIFDNIKSTLDEHLENKISIHTLPSHQYYDSIASKQFTIGVTSWVGDFADPSAFLQLWNNPNPALGHNYNNEAYQTLLSISHLQSGEIRNAILQEAETMLLDSTVVIPLHQLYAINIVRSDILEGWYSNPLDLHPFGAIHIKRDQPKEIRNLTMLLEKYSYARTRAHSTFNTLNTR